MKRLLLPWLNCKLMGLKKKRNIFITQTHISKIKCCQLTNDLPEQEMGFVETTNSYPIVCFVANTELCHRLLLANVLQ